MKANEKELWLLWERLQILRHSDFNGKIECLCCKIRKPYTEMKLKIAYRTHTPFLFIKENNYFCCVDCEENISPNKRYELHTQKTGVDIRQKVKKHKTVYWNDQDVAQATDKLRRLLKNHDHERFRKQ